MLERCEGEEAREEAEVEDDQEEQEQAAEGRARGNSRNVHPVPQRLVLGNALVGGEEHGPARLLTRDPAPPEAEPAQKVEDDLRGILIRLELGPSPIELCCSRLGVGNPLVELAPKPEGLEHLQRVAAEQ